MAEDARAHLKPPLPVVGGQFGTRPREAPGVSRRGEYRGDFDVLLQCVIQDLLEEVVGDVGVAALGALRVVFAQERQIVSGQEDEQGVGSEPDQGVDPPPPLGEVPPAGPATADRRGGLVVAHAQKEVVAVVVRVLHRVPKTSVGRACLPNTLQPVPRPLAPQVVLLVVVAEDVSAVVGVGISQHGVDVVGVVLDVVVLHDEASAL